MSSVRRTRVRGLAALGLSVYVVMLVVSPVLHHDLECHARSPVHCTACVANPVASGSEPGVTLSAGFVALGDVATPPESQPPFTATAPAAGRSPPTESL